MGTPILGTRFTWTPGIFCAAVGVERTKTSGSKACQCRHRRPVARKKCCGILGEYTQTQRSAHRCPEDSGGTSADRPKIDGQTLLASQHAAPHVQAAHKRMFTAQADHITRQVGPGCSGAIWTAFADTGIQRSDGPLRESDRFARATASRERPPGSSCLTGVTPVVGPDTV
jgi:hypothetical protein